MALLWRDKRDICLLMNIHNAPAEGNFCIEGGKAIKLQTVMDYNRHRGYVDKGDRIANSYSISCHTFKWMKKFFFHMLDLSILSSYILHSLCGGKKISHTDFQYTLMRSMLAYAGPEQRVPRPLGTPPNVELHIARLEVFSSKHWPILSETQLRCRVCKDRGVTQKVLWSALSVKWDCAFKYHVLKITIHRQSSNITCDLPKKTWGLKPICKYKKLKFLHIPYNFLSIHGLKIITSFLNTGRNLSVLFPKKKSHLMHCLILFGPRNINIFCKPCAKI